MKRIVLILVMLLTPFEVFAVGDPNDGDNGYSQQDSAPDGGNAAAVQSVIDR